MEHLDLIPFLFQKWLLILFPDIYLLIMDLWGQIIQLWTYGWFGEFLIKGRGTKGNILTKNSLKNVELKEKGVSTLKPRKIWFELINQSL